MSAKWPWDDRGFFCWWVAVAPLTMVLLAQTYDPDPYGNLYASAGVDSTAFGYAGEQEDANRLVFLGPGTTSRVWGGS